MGEKKLGSAQLRTTLFQAWDDVYNSFVLEEIKDRGASAWREKRKTPPTQGQLWGDFIE